MPSISLESTYLAGYKTAVCLKRNTLLLHKYSIFSKSRLREILPHFQPPPAPKTPNEKLKLCKLTLWKVVSVVKLQCVKCVLFNGI